MADHAPLSPGARATKEILQILHASVVEANPALATATPEVLTGAMVGALLGLAAGIVQDMLSADLSFWQAACQDAWEV